MTKYRYLTKPYRHQVLALKKMLRNGFGGALLMEPRTGKSKVVIDWLSILYMQNKVDRALIVCPPNVISVWEDEFKKHCPMSMTFSYGIATKGLRADCLSPLRTVC